MSVCLCCVWRQLWVTASPCRNSWKSLPPLFSLRNLFSCSTLLPKLVPEIYSASRLVQETCTCVLCWSILYKFFLWTTSFMHIIEHSSVPGQKLSGTWHEPCNVIGRRVVLVQDTVMNLHQIFRASFLSKFLAPVSWVYIAGIKCAGTVPWARGYN